MTNNGIKKKSKLDGKAKNFNEILYTSLLLKKKLLYSELQLRFKVY